MNLTIAIITIASIVFFVLPIIYLTKRGKAMEKRLFQELSKLAEKNNGTISEQEFFGHTAIGVDKKTHWLFFTRKTSEKEITQTVDLSKIQACQILNERNSVNHKNNSHSVTERICLALKQREKNSPEIILELYNIDHDGLSMSGEIQISERWARIINQNIPKIK